MGKTYFCSSTRIPKSLKFSNLWVAGGYLNGSRPKLNTACWYPMKEAAGNIPLLNDKIKLTNYDLFKCEYKVSLTKPS